jgi:hypothetical protein
MLNISHVKVQLFATADQDLDTDPHGSALVWLPGSGSALSLKSGS